MASHDNAKSRTHSQSSDSVQPESYFNDLSQQPTHNPTANESQPKSKRMACVLCRKRKLKCDGARPACATCARLSHDCAYDEIRKKSGPKRGYVKALEARLAQVETMLKTQDPVTSAEGSVDGQASNPTTTQGDSTEATLYQDPNDMDMGIAEDTLDWISAPLQEPINDFANIMSNLPKMASNPSATNPYQEPWGSLIGLDIEEPLPPPEVIDELHDIYFTKRHPTLCIIHRPRYLMAMANNIPRLRPPVALQYIVWALAASVSDKYDAFHRHYYERARHYFERDEMKAMGETMMTLRHVQALALIAAYEFKSLMFPRAWQSSGKASRLGLMMSLHRVDGAGMDVKQCLPGPKDFVETEERRRTYWLCFQEDRFASIGTGWPMSLSEEDIMTHLPCSDEAFENGIAEPTISLKQALEPGGAAKLSPYGGVTVLACIFGRNLLHLHRPTANEEEENLSGAFWKRHRALDNVILGISMSLPERLRLPLAVTNPNVVFMSMCLHTSTICLHQAAIFKAEKHRGLVKVAAESKLRCITAAAEVANVMKMSSHQDMAAFNPFTCFCLYVASRVFIQYMKSRPDDENIKSSLYFMLAAMHAMKKKNQLAESFLVQLDIDLEIAGLDDMRDLSSDAVQYKYKFSPGGCPMDLNTADPQDPKAARLRPLTFGNNGIALHSAPDEASDEHIYPGKWMHTEFAARENSISIDGHAMPVRQKSTSSFSNNSPQTLSSPEMDVSSGSATNISNGPTPPAARNTSYDGNGIFAHSRVSYNTESLSTYNFESMQTGNDLAGAAVGCEFSSYTQLGQGGMTGAFDVGGGDGGGKLRGAMPVTVADLGSMTDEEFTNLMNGNNGGW